jgi:predicted DNA-binding transcriptional regulator YafY
MPRNTQVARILLVLRRLESARGATLEELARALPPEYPKNLRTLRRDLAAIEEAGFPLVTDRSDGQIRWKLMDDFRRVPAPGFSATELMAITLSRNLLRPLEGTEVHASLQSALHKAAAALPLPALEYVRRLEDFFSVGLGPHKTYRQHRETLETLHDAIRKLRTVQMRYFSASRNVTTRREVDPYHLRYAAGALYLIGYCRWRKDVRLFAVDRIRSLSITDHAYQMPLGFDVEAYVQDALMVMRGPVVTVELAFAKATAAWVKDRLWHHTQTAKSLKDGRLHMTLQVADTPELVGWILHFGSGVQVLRPNTLREKVLAEARKILGQG